MGQLFGPSRGGLGYSVIIVGFILGAITGTVAAQVIAMALITMPVMMRYGYNVRYITGVLAASGTITQLVPPSLVLIVMADQLGKSVGDMYLGAWGPSLLQIGLFAGYTFVLSVFLPHHVPAVPRDALTLRGWPLWRKCLMGIIPSAVLIFVVLGTMMLGLATPTEAGAMGAIGAIVLAAIHHKDLSSKGRQDAPHRHRRHRRRRDHRRGARRGRNCSRLSFTVVYLAVVWLCLEAVRIPDLHDLIKQGCEIDHAALHHGGVHPDRLDLLLGRVPRRGRRRLGRAPADRHSRRRLGLPDGGESVRVLPGVLPRLLRDRLHHRADGGAGRAEGAGARGGGRMRR